MGLIWIESESCWGDIIEHYAHYSRVRFFKNGHFHEEIIENDDLTELRELGIDYESD
jgi:hypothetical protein